MEGRKLVCPKCNEFLEAPAAASSAKAKGPGLFLGEATYEVVREATPGERWGMSSLALGLGSILILVIPYLGYAALLLGSIGLILGIVGLFHSGLRGVSRLGQALINRSASTPEDDGPVNYPLAGIIASLLGLLLTLLPYILERLNR
jgi:hypothetical protein